MRTRPHIAKKYHENNLLRHLRCMWCHDCLTPLFLVFADAFALFAFNGLDFLANDSSEYFFVPVVLFGSESEHWKNSRVIAVSFSFSGGAWKARFQCVDEYRPR